MQNFPPELGSRCRRHRAQPCLELVVTQLSEIRARVNDERQPGAQGQVCRHRRKWGRALGLLPAGGSAAGFPHGSRCASLVCVKLAVSPPGLDVLGGPACAELRWVGAQCVCCPAGGLSTTLNKVQEIELKKCLSIFSCHLHHFFLFKTSLYTY